MGTENPKMLQYLLKAMVGSMTLLFAGCYRMTSPSEASEGDPAAFTDTDRDTSQRARTDPDTDGTESYSGALPGDDTDTDTVTRGKDTLFSGPTDTMSGTGDSTDSTSGVSPGTDTQRDSDSASETEPVRETETEEVPFSCPAWVSDIDGGVVEAGGVDLGDAFVDDVLFSNRLDFAVLHRRDGSGLVRKALPRGDETPITPISPGAMTWFEPDESLLVTIHSDPCCDLSIVTLASGEAHLLSDRVCRHIVTPDRSRVLLVRECTGDSGTLELVDPATSEHTEIGPWSRGRDQLANLAISPDSRWFAYTGDSDTTDHVPIIGSTRDGATDILDDAPHFGLQFIGDNALLMQRSPTEHDWHPALVVYRPDDGDMITLSEDLYPAILPDPVGYRLSPDGRMLVAARVNDTGEPFAANDIYAAATDGSGLALLGQDGAPFQGSSLGFYHAFKINWDGSRVLYVADWYNTLVSTSADGAHRHEVTTDLESMRWEPSPYTDHVCYVDRAGTEWGPYEVRLTDLGTEETLVLRGSPDWTAPIAFTSSGRGVLFYGRETPEEPYVLQHYALLDGHATILGRWNESGATKHKMDPHGCILLYATDLGPHPGLRLQPQP